MEFSNALTLLRERTRAAMVKPWTKEQMESVTLAEISDILGGNETQAFLHNLKKTLLVEYDRDARIAMATEVRECLAASVVLSAKYPNLVVADEADALDDTVKISLHSEQGVSHV